jgi:hypothetical protein
MFGTILIYGVGLFYNPMFAATGHVVHINPDRSHSGTEKGQKIISTTRLPNSKTHPLKKKEKRCYILTNKMSKHQRGECWSHLGCFPRIYCVWYAP